MSVAYLFRTSCLRLADNPALVAAASCGSVAVGFCCADVPKALGAASLLRLQHSLRALDADLDGQLWITELPFADAVIELARLAGTKQVFTCTDPSPQLRACEQEAVRKCAAVGIELVIQGTSLLHEPSALRTKSGGAFQVFTPFWRSLFTRLQEHPPVVVSAPKIQLHSVGSGIGIDAVCVAEHWHDKFVIQAGEGSARNRLRAFINKQLADYATGRDYPSESMTSGLSACLRFGEISPARIYAEVADLADADKFLSELGWREFSYHVLHQQPDLDTVNLKSSFAAFPWRKDKRLLELWKQGKTGIPLVDAGMQELHQTGYMHNRVRMITASFLVKNLLIDWRAGAEHFWDELFDADLANNYASWQWVAGCGYDAAPYFRIFNPVRQGQRFDPAGEYVRRYLPVLSNLPDKFIHSPWEAPDCVLLKAGVALGKNYPKPLVDLGLSRKQALVAYQQIKGLD